MHIIQLDNGGLHSCFDLEIPEKVILLFQPPYSPQVNLIERLWEHLKKELKWNNFDELTELSQKIQMILNSLTQEVVASLTGWQFILDALFIAGI
jgi:transposase